MTEARLLRPLEAAERLGMGRSLLYELLKSGELKSLKFGRKRLIALIDLEEFIEARRRQADEEERRFQRRLKRSVR